MSDEIVDRTESSSFRVCLRQDAGSKVKSEVPAQTKRQEAKAKSRVRSAVSDSPSQRHFTSLHSCHAIKMSTQDPAQENQHGESYEEEHVHTVYEQIASHFSSTRYKVSTAISAISHLVHETNSRS